MTEGTRTHALNERGIAAVMALIVVLALSLLVSAFLAVSAFEPQISQNLADSTQARYAADAGIEWAFDQLVATTSWNTLLNGAVGCATPVAPVGWTNVSVPNVAGTFTVSLRNDCQAGDNLITGVALDNVTGIATQTGVQANKSPATYEQNVESAFTSGTSSQVTQKEGSVAGKDQGSTALTTGLNAIAASNALTPTTMQTFLDALAANPKTQILQSTMSCPMQINGAGGSPTSTPTLTNGCGTNQTLNLGTPSNPQLIYFRGDLDPTSAFTGLTVNGKIQGAGILVIEDGDLKNVGTLNWQGIVVVTGRYVGAGFMDGSTTNINGAFVSNETVWNETNGYSEVYIGTQTGSANFRYSKQALDMMKTIRAFHTVYGWRNF